MFVTILGSDQCVDCVEAIEELKKHKIEFEFRNFSTELSNLKEFLKIRDYNDMFQEVKENNQIGIPCFIFKDGTITLDLEEVLKKHNRNK